MARVVKTAAGAAKTRRKQIPAKIASVIWARAAGRCEYDGCNKPLIGDLLSGAPNANLAYIAHIVADAPDGPRGDVALSPRLQHDPDNLMLMCDVHHRIIDRDRVDEHPRERLLEMKRKHEERIRIVTQMSADKGCHVLRYAARIGTNESPVSQDAVRLALTPERYPVENGVIDLDVTGLELQDHDEVFWTTQVANMRLLYESRMRGRFEKNEIKRLEVFGLAPIPLLFELGRLISDISDAQVRQLLRHPKGWSWDVGSEPLVLDVGQAPAGAAKDVALKLAVSAEITDDRIEPVAPGMPIWSITAQRANNDIIRTPSDIATFARTFRGVLDQIKVAHGQDVVVHVFPAIPVSTAIEAGRSWQPKAHPSLWIYDQNKKLDGFRLAHKLD